MKDELTHLRIGKWTLPFFSFKVYTHWDSKHMQVCTHANTQCNWQPADPGNLPTIYNMILSLGKVINYEHHRKVLYLFFFIYNLAMCYCSSFLNTAEFSFSFFLTTFNLWVTSCLNFFSILLISDFRCQSIQSH